MRTGFDLVASAFKSSKLLRAALVTMLVCLVLAGTKAAAVATVAAKIASFMVSSMCFLDKMWAYRADVTT